MKSERRNPSFRRSALARLGPASLLLIGGIYCLTAGCEQVEPQNARQRMLEDLLLQRADNLDRSDRQAIAGSLVRAEAEYSVDALLLLAVIEQESNFRLRAKSRKGALGLMQIRHSTALDVAERHGIAYRHATDLYNPSVNITIGAAYLAELKESFDSWNLALIAYHRGPRNLRKARTGGRPVKSRYADQVKIRYRRFQALCQSKSSLLSCPGPVLKGRVL